MATPGAGRPALRGLRPTAPGFPAPAAYSLQPGGRGPAGLGLAGLPTAPGCYALALRLDGPQTLTIGRLGSHRLAAGWYVYCGSAQGPGGLRGRVGRHLRPAPVRRWHVDHLRGAATVVAVWLWPGAPRTHECALATFLAALPGAARALPGFGSSDCRCPGHLVALSRPPAW
jgi:Uri superfamily endonuclease